MMEKRLFIDYLNDIFDAIEKIERFTQIRNRCPVGQVLERGIIDPLSSIEQMFKSRTTAPPSHHGVPARYSPS